MAQIRYERYEADVEVAFAEEKDVSVIGVTALESLGYRVNPITEKLEYIGLLAAQPISIAVFHCESCAAQFTLEQSGWHLVAKPCNKTSEAYGVRFPPQTPKNWRI